jgi:hypothetical protein
MVARQVGEGAGGDVETVETPLDQAVRRRFHGDVLDTLVLDLLQRLVQRHRVGRRHVAVARAGARRHADGADRSRLKTGRLPDLAHEVGHRRLAVGAGHRHHRLGLWPIEARHHAREAALRIGFAQHRYVDGADVVIGTGENDGRPGGYRLRHERGPVHLGAGQRGEQATRHDGAAIGRDRRDVDPAQRRVGGQDVGGKFGKLHRCGPDCL